MEGNDIVTLARTGYEPSRLSRLPLDASAPLALAIRTGEPSFFEDDEATRHAHPHVAWQEGFQARAVLPLRADADSWGALTLSWRERRDFPRVARRGLQAFAAAVAQSLRRARQALDAEEARAELNDFVSTSSIGLHWVAEEGTIVWANEADHALLGYARDEYVGHNIREFHADADDLADILRVLVGGGRLVDRRATLRHKDGSLRHVLIDSSGLFKDGKFVHTRCFTRDVTPYVERSRRLEALLTALGELGDGVSLQTSGRILWANDAYAKLLGYSVAEVLSPEFDPRALIPPEERDAIRARVSARSTRRSEKYETTVLRKDGSRAPFEVSVNAMGGAPDDPRIVILRDITHRRRREEELRDQRDLYDALLGAVSDLGQGVVLSNAEGRIQYLNRAFASLVGRNVAELLDDRFDLATLFAPDEIPRVLKQIEGTADDAPRHFDARLRRADGTIVHVEVASLALMLNGARHRLALVRDITSEKEREGELEAARRSLAQSEKLAALGQLVSGVAHEVRTPLTIIETNAHVLERRAQKALEGGDGDVRALAEVVPIVTREIVSAIERANNLVKHLQRFTRRAPRKWEPIDYSAAIEEAVDLFRATNRGGPSVVHAIEPTPPARGDASQVQQVVINLLENAREASARASAAIELSVRHDPSARAIVLRVADAGVGMTLDVQARMFEPLFTTKAHGTGLGLSIIRHIMDEHGGSIECESEPGKGTTFTLRFPAP